MKLVKIRHTFTLTGNTIIGNKEGTWWLSLNHVQSTVYSTSTPCAIFLIPALYWAKTQKSIFTFNHLASTCHYVFAQSCDAVNEPFIITTFTSVWGVLLCTPCTALPWCHHTSLPAVRQPVRASSRCCSTQPVLPSCQHTANIHSACRAATTFPYQT